MTSNNIISGKKIYLSTIEIENIEQIRNWRNDDRLRIYFRETRELTINDQKEWFNRINNKLNNEIFFSIKLNTSNEFIGVAGLNYINLTNRNCQLSLYIGKEFVYIDDNGWADEVTKMLTNYAFNVLNLKKIYVEVFDYDRKKTELLKMNNYIQEGELKQHVFKNGKYFSSFIYSLINKD